MLEPYAPAHFLEEITGLPQQLDRIARTNAG
jgi:hypothetical protein